MKKEPDIVDAKFQHGDALDAHAEGKARDFLRIVADEAKDRRVDHAGAHDLEPAGALAYTTLLPAGYLPASATEQTTYIDLRAGLGERKIARTKSHAGFLAECLPEKMRQHAFEI